MFHDHTFDGDNGGGPSALVIVISRPVSSIPLYLVLSLSELERDSESVSIKSCGSVLENNVQRNVNLTSPFDMMASTRFEITCS